MFRGRELCGMLAQLVEHLLDVQGVRDSSSLHPTIFLPRKEKYVQKPAEMLYNIGKERPENCLEDG